MFDKRAILSKVKSLYDKGENLTQYLRNQTGDRENSLEDIMISYDFQSGSYIESMYRDDSFAKITKNIGRELISTIKKLHTSGGVALEAGTGECTFLREVAGKLNVDELYAFDISWSRVRSGKRYLAEGGGGKVNLFVGDMYSIPLADNSMDIVFTRQSVEPNGGHERELLQELYRITGEYLILQEPAYEFASAEAQERMRHHGYVRGLLQTARDLNWEIVEYDLMPEYCWYSYNPIARMVIKKKTDQIHKLKTRYACPVTGAPLEDFGDAFFSRESLLAYPKLDGIPMLVSSSGIVATKFMEFRKEQ